MTPPTCDIDADYHRLIPSRFPPVPLYERLGGADIQAAAIAMEAITNPRLHSMPPSSQVGPVSTGPSGPQNWNHAPFAYPNPEGTTFLNPAYKVLELVLGVRPALAVAIQRREAFLGGSEEPPVKVDMRALVHPVKGRFADLRAEPFDPDQAKRWRLGAALYDSDIQGIVFRRPDLPEVEGIIVFDQAALGRAVQSEHYRFVWDGKAIQTIGNFSTDEVLTRETLFSELGVRKAA